MPTIDDIRAAIERGDKEAAMAAYESVDAKRGLSGHDQQLLSAAIMEIEVPAPSEEAPVPDKPKKGRK